MVDLRDRNINLNTEETTLKSKPVSDSSSNPISNFQSAEVNQRNTNNKPRLLCALPSKWNTKIAKYPGINQYFTMVAVDEEINRHNLLSMIKRYRPQIVIIYEDLPGSAGNPQFSLDILIRDIRLLGIRVVFLCSNRRKGDILLSNLVLYGVWDIVNRDRITISDLAKMLRFPNTWADVSVYIKPLIMKQGHVYSGEPPLLNHNDVELSHVSQQQIAKRQVKSNQKSDSLIQKIFGF